MTLVVQAVCPGCRHTLRIPAQWINQAMRCKHCGLILQAKAAVRPAASTSVSSLTPLPPTIPSVPVAVPVSVPRAAAASRSGWRKGLFLAACILLVAGITSAVCWPQLSRLVAPPAQPEQAPNDERPVEKEKPPAVAQAPQPAPQPDPPKRSDPPKMQEPPVKPPSKPPDKPPDSARPPAKPPVPVDPPAAGTSLPRRALAVSVNNYYYANPVNFGTLGRNGRSVLTLLDRLHAGLHVPKDQLGLLSDAAPLGTARQPLKPVIEKTVSDFLDTSREQDRILVLFIGHAVEVEDEPYLVPLEGDLEDKETLIPLKWFYERLAGCRARQKVLVLDVCRLNPSRGQERPGSAPMGAKLDAALKAPPPGVQVWTACVAGQNSYEFEYVALNNGVFQEALYDVLGQLAQGGPQGPDDLLPMPRLAELVNARMKDLLDKEGKVQTSRLSGEAPAAGAPFDSTQPRPPRPAIAAPLPPEGGPASAELVQTILKDVDVPPIKMTRDEQLLRPESMPVFSAKLLEEYRDDGGKTPLREAVLRTRDLLNAHLKGKRLREEFRAPANEARFKDEIKDYQTREVAALLGELTEALDDLKAVGKERAKEPKRWQANYDYILARLEMQIAYLYEYTTLLGSMRKELPPRDPQIHGGWRLASQAALQGDAAGKRLANDARKILTRLAEEHPHTPWEVLAKRERWTALGLDWQPIK